MGAGVRDRRNRGIVIGDLVEYRFKNWNGYETKVGLVTYIDGPPAWQTDTVIKVLGFDGEIYTIHPTYLTKIERD